MARCFAKVLEEEIEEATFYSSDLVNTKTTIPPRVGEKRWIYVLLSRWESETWKFGFTKLINKLLETDFTMKVNV